MKLNHINLCVSDVAAAGAFFTEFFGLRPVPDKGREGVFAMLEDDAGLALVISNFTKEAEFVYPRDFHVGFSQESAAQVDATPWSWKSATPWWTTRIDFPAFFRVD